MRCFPAKKKVGLGLLSDIRIVLEIRIATGLGLEF